MIPYSCVLINKLYYDKSRKPLISTVETTSVRNIG